MTTPVCPICEGLGWFTYNAPPSDPDFGKPQRCECMRETDLRARRAKLERASSLTDGMRARMTFERMEQGTLSESQMQAWEAALIWAKKPERGWLVLTGDPGLGKTHLLVAATVALEKAERMPLYVVAPELLRYLRAGIGTGDAEARLDLIRSVDVLLLDDLGAEYATDWATEQFYLALDYRYREELPTAIASNASIDTWNFRLGSRASDGLLVREVALAGDDYRALRAKGVR